MSGKNRKTGNLVALGSAAVVAVYGAGFMRTAEAAQRFAEQSDERRVVTDDVAPGVSVAGNSAAATTPDSGVAKGAANTSVPVPSSAASAASNTESGHATANAGLAAPEVKKVDATTANAATAIAANANAAKLNGTTLNATGAAAPASRAGNVSVPMPPEVTTVMSASGVAVTAVPVETRAAVVAENPAASTTPAPVSAASTIASATTAPAASAPVPAPVAAAKPAPTKAPPSAAETAPIPTVNASAANGASTGATKYKDGEYTGYGTSRHGDVEVYLETTDGKITYIKISQCLTQYSCSWIEDLPKQVLARQSTKVDAVSGATQSANAFYYALVAALAKAK